MSTSLAFVFLQYPFGIVLILAGLDKLFRLNLIVRWEKYISPPAGRILPSTAFLMVVGIAEIILGGLLFTTFYHIAAYIAAAWLFIIALNLLILGDRDIAFRDILIGFALLALAQL